ncbi:hypothetical protein [Parablautia muri]|uniref:Uncharacterized protein n=1 Tax=Parablautia muri TaxID=2320879 RepID=A0A9X5BG48_9FIRM|nr:hypothetical protein [Parablautia muri]NBJ93002.1 hypothetical protein [Parablautia muri]
MSKAIRITNGMLRQEIGSVRGIMGYLLGVTFLALSLNDFLGYAMEMKEPVNICEAFIVSENQGVAGRFWVLGYLLVISDAPFAKGNTYLLLYRSGRRIWNMGMLLYISTQAFMYTMCLAVVSVVASIPYGFFGGLWSSPVYMLGTNASSAVAEKYYVFFEGVGMMKYMTALQAFGITFLYMLCYFIFLGVLLYVCNLVLGSFWGLAAVATAHLGGVILSVIARVHQSPAYYVDGTGSYWKYPGMMLAFILVMSLVSLFAAERVDIQAR